MKNVFENLNNSLKADNKLEQEIGQSRISKYLQEALNLKEDEFEKITLLKAENLPRQYHSQLKFLNDKRLNNVMFAVIPDNLWIKGDQPSESMADIQLINIKQSYFEIQENSDEIAWFCHELAHCQVFLNLGSSVNYQNEMNKFAFSDLAKYMTISRQELEQALNQANIRGANESEIARLNKLLKATDKDFIQMPIYYPNNPVEQFTFTKQFQYLKKQGRTREKILVLLGEYYEKEDFSFFNRLLDNVYGESGD